MNHYLAYVGLTGPLVLGILVSLAVFSTVLTVALPLLAGNELKTRMKSVALERDQMRTRERARMAAEKDGGRGASLRQVSDASFAASVVERFNLKKALVDDKTVAKLRVAGFRGNRALTLFLFCRLMLPLVLLAGATVYVFGLGLLAERAWTTRLLVCLVVGFIGFYAPNMYVSNAAGKRGKSITRAWPDALDLLLICVEAGNSIEAGFRRVADEIGVQSVPLAEEMVLVCAELSYLPDRRQAYENLSARTGLEGVRSVCTALIQAERYGTPLGSALRTLAQENRDMRMNAAEKKAAALPPKLTVPMIVFFLPVLFGVIIGPAVIRVWNMN